MLGDAADSSATISKSHPQKASGDDADDHNDGWLAR